MCRFDLQLGGAPGPTPGVGGGRDKIIVVNTVYKIIRRYMYRLQYIHTYICREKSALLRANNNAEVIPLNILAYSDCFYYSLVIFIFLFFLEFQPKIIHSYTHSYSYVQYIHNLQSKLVTGVQVVKYVKYIHMYTVIKYHS